jgi:hypothetical protein
MVITDVCDKVVPMLVVQLGRYSDKTTEDLGDVLQVLTIMFPLDISKKKVQKKVRKIIILIIILGGEGGSSKKRSNFFSKNKLKKKNQFFFPKIPLIPLIPLSHLDVKWPMIFANDHVSTPICKHF